MNYKTYAEYLRHPKFLAVKEHVKLRSGGRCENTVFEHDGPIRCRNMAVDVHHIAYCAWGQFDVEENLLHVCRACHEDLHTCTSCGGMLKAEAIKAGRDICFDCYSSCQD